jgi:DNA modification methylase
MGSGTTALVAGRLGRRFVGIELNPEYMDIARRRLDEDGFVHQHDSTHGVREAIGS